VPMGAVVVRNGIYEQITNAAPEGAIELFHGYTYSAHPMACAAGIATQAIYRREDVFARGAALAPRFQESVFALRDIGIVRDVRGFGLLAGIDLEPDGGPGARGALALRRFYDAGLVVRMTGDTLILAPALVAEPEQADRICEIVDEVLRSL